jgi:hypothetical protein
MAQVPIDHRFSFYALTGDWFAAGCWLCLGAIAAGQWFGGRLRLGKRER